MLQSKSAIGMWKWIFTLSPYSFPLIPILCLTNSKQFLFIFYSSNNETNMLARTKNRPVLRRKSSEDIPDILPSRIETPIINGDSLDMPKEPVNPRRQRYVFLSYQKYDLRQDYLPSPIMIK